MITVITGVPGAGKTLFALAYVKAKAERENRPVYYSGIPELKLPWLELDQAEDWFKCPPNSIIVIDECQRAFRPRGLGGSVPEHISRFETHRHQGLDVFLITQHPMLIDQNIRRLAGQHFHGVRKFGLARAEFNEWGSCHEITKRNLSEAVKHKFSYPKEVFSYYKSAEVHTHKRRIPARVYFLGAVPFLVLGLGWYGYKAFTAATDTRGKIAQVSGAGGVAPGALGGGQGAARGPKTTAEYLRDNSPRIAGLAFTAPVYDEVTKPVEPPIPAAVMMTAKRGCVAYSQQGTPLAMSQELCKQILTQGIYIPWREQAKPAEGVKPAIKLS